MNKVFKGVLLVSMLLISVFFSNPILADENYPMMGMMGDKGEGSMKGMGGKDEHKMMEGMDCPMMKGQKTEPQKGADNGHKH